MDLQPFKSVDLSALRWMGVDGPTSTFQLLAGDAPIARLSWRKTHGSLALAETADARWTFKRAGFLHGHVTARTEGSERDVARLVPIWRDHRIEFVGGNRTYDLKRSSILVPAWDLVDGSTHAELVNIEPVREGRRLLGGIYEVEPPARTLPELPLLLAISWYFVVLSWFEDETVAEWTDHAEGHY